MVTWPWRHPCSQPNPCFQLSRDWVPTYLSIPFDPMKLSFMLQFYDVRTYLWSATSRGHGGGFLWRWEKRPQLLKSLTYSNSMWLTRCAIRWTQQDRLSGGEERQLWIAHYDVVGVKLVGFIIPVERIRWGLLTRNSTARRSNWF